MSAEWETPTSIETFSGRYLDLADPDPADIALADVASGLAKTCRFAGQVRRFYSVAEHAVLCADYVAAYDGDPWRQLAALHHDDHEAFTGDLTAPLRGLWPGYRDLAARIQVAIEEALGLGLSVECDDPLVHAADMWARAAEAYYLLPSQGKPWAAEFVPDDVPESVRYVRGLGELPRGAERRWLARHESLVEAVAA